MKKQRGITLIALVITIIILLILAGVSIALLTGENGILTKANTSQTQNTIGKEKEEINLAYSYAKANKLQISDISSVTKEELEDGFTKNSVSGVTITSEVNKIKVTFSDSKNVYEIDSNGTISGPTTGGTNITPPPTTEVGENTVFKDGNSNDKEAIIPKGFKVSDVTSEQKIDTGLVVIGPDGSEFVWVPVDKQTLCVDGTTGKEIAKTTTGVDAKGNTNYQGKLYSFSGITSSEMTGYGQGTREYREPDVLSDYDWKSVYLEVINNILQTNLSNDQELGKYLQEEYNEIIKSIKANGGFYIARYESSISGSTDTVAGTTGNIQSKKGVMPAAAESRVTDMWYGLYAKQKTYTKTLTQIDTNLKSSMIYGSTYDATLNWALNGSNKSKITQSSIMHDSMGEPEKTGALESDVINNIYDLGNNFYEWTIETYDTFARVIRGGHYQSSNSPADREHHNPFNDLKYGGSRMILYL